MNELDKIINDLINNNNDPYNQYYSKNDFGLDKDKHKKMYDLFTSELTKFINQEKEDKTTQKIEEQIEQKVENKDINDWSTFPAIYKKALSWKERAKILNSYKHYDKQGNLRDVREIDDDYVKNLLNWFHNAIINLETSSDDLLKLENKKIFTLEKYINLLSTISELKNSKGYLYLKEKAAKI